ncbi:MAG: ATP-binding protein [Dehalococcoidia bacterium]|nr:ATP-binding protein [Dehalococcoidia bacterium]
MTTPPSGPQQLPMSPQAPGSQRPPMSPQDRAKLEAMKRSWEQRRNIKTRLDKIRYKIAVYSGKGGVGKTTVAVNLAVMLAQQHQRVGLMDADIDCPNVVKAMKIEQRARYEDQEHRFIPAERWGVRVISTGFFQEKEDEAIIFRGPMIHNTITQFLEMTDWGDLDYLVVDMPPGTSDAAITIMQTLPLDGFVIVATPQELAQIDALRSINMIKKLNMHPIGVVENFSGDIFGHGGGEAVAKHAEIPFLGRLEMRGDYRDTSKPTVLGSKHVHKEYEQLVNKIRAALEVPATA